MNRLPDIPQSDIQPIADAFNVPVDEILSRKRTMHLVAIRAAIAQVLTLAGYTSTQIGRFIGRDRTSVSHFVNEYKPVAGFDEYIANVQHHIHSLTVQPM